MAYTIGDLFEHAVDLMPERIALESGDRKRTYAELEERSNALAHTLRELGVQPGDAVGLYSRNTIEAVEAMLAIFKARAVMANVNYRYVEHELEHLFTDSGMKVLIHEQQYTDRVLNVLSKTPTAITARIVIDDETPAIDDDGHRYEDVLARGRTDRDFEERTNDDLYMLYTGGTTGKPKGVVWRQEDVWRVLGGGIDWYSGRPIEDEWEHARTGADSGQLVRFAIPPFIHGGSQWAIFQSLFAGGKAVVYPEFEPHAIWQAVADHGVNVVFITGDAMARPMIDALDERDYDTSTVVSVASSAALFSPAVKDRYLERFPNAVIVDAIGSSETGFGGMGMAVKGKSRVGAPTVKADPETHVLREDGTPVTPGSGEVGVLARSGHIPLRYHGDPVKSAKTFVVYDGVRYSLPGDHAVLEADGTITMLGRGSGSINTGGEKVFPEEVEAALKGHPAVLDTVVVGVPDDRFGQRVAAVIATRDGARPSLNDLNATVRTELAGYKCPRSVWFVEVVKRSPAGKPDYRWAAEIAASRDPDDSSTPGNTATKV
ncbi:acyl-CoA synthetase [Gordonia alkaliphila]|uniref:Acyl-CoA synthetase n=1 Tax=Gordonia alkaliphila TaxID=1053547 RepID=A0ABP8YVX9_9ACTN|nr:acyl-CoA synthetase [Gordonia alkaliphila]MCK0439497.1 acyl-CoA synthetase [Gordonia alkaliphila]